MHSRLAPKKNKFIYKQDYVLLEASHSWSQSCRLFSLNRMNFFSLDFAKYGIRDGSNPYDYVRNLLEQYCGHSDWLDQVFLLTQPRLLGWSFNPVSFWFLMDKEKQIRAVLSEVNNTFGEHHKYFAFHKDFSPIKHGQQLTAEKVFYVSPFMKVEGEYQFSFKFTDKMLGVWINYIVDENPILLTSIVGKRKPLNTQNIIKSFFKIPFANFKTPVLIHWQALKIWLKGIPYINRAPHNNDKVKICR